MSQQLVTIRMDTMVAMENCATPKNSMSVTIEVLVAREPHPPRLKMSFETNAGFKVDMIHDAT
jgi:hypothetical protein